MTATVRGWAGSAELRQPLHHRSPPHDRRSGPSASQALLRAEPTGVASADALASRTLSWFVVAALAYRVALTPILIAGAIGNGRREVPLSLLATMGAVFSGDLVLLLGVLAGRFRRLLGSNVFLVVDLCVTVALNLWATSVLQRGTFFLPGRDIVWGYTFGVVAFWTGLRGARAGAVLVAGGALLELVMARLNGAGFDFTGAMEYLARLAWLVSAFVLPLVIMALAHQGARVAVAEGLRAGREAERAQTLRALHDTVLQTLEGLALQAASEHRPAEERLREVRAAALQQARELRTALDRDTQRTQDGLASSLQTLICEYHGRGLQVELVAVELDAEPPASITEALVGTVREALTNVGKHAGVRYAVVRAASSAAGVEVVVRDQGRGFDPAVSTEGYGLTHSIKERMVLVGGRAEVWSAPGRGTRIRLCWNP
jgi:signal transduction histidine kinase